MLIEDTLKVPLMNKENDYEDEENWQCSTEFHPSFYRNVSVFKLVLLYTLVIVPWALLALFGLSSLNWSQKNNSKYYIRPDLTYSKYPSFFELLAGVLTFLRSSSRSR